MSLIGDNRIIFTLQNDTDFRFLDLDLNFDSGEYKEGGPLPTQLDNFGVQATAYMGDKWGCTGVSGTLSFTMNHATQWLYISSPYIGRNKIGYGVTKDAAQKQAGVNYDKHGNKRFSQTIRVKGVAYTLTMCVTAGDARMTATFSGPSI